MKKKKILLFLVLSFSLAISSFAFANVREFIAEIYFPKLTITHEAINTVSANTRVLKPKISADFGRYSSATARVEYYINGDSSNLEYAPERELTIYNNTEFFITLPTLSDSVEYVHYRIRVTAKSDAGGSSVVYCPDTEISDEEYIKAVITSSATATVTASAGGTVEYNDGNQDYSGTTITFDPGSVEGSGEICIEEISLDDLFSSLFPVSAYVRSVAYKVARTIATADIDRNKMLAGYRVYTNAAGLSIISQGYANFSYGASGSTATKFDVLYSADGAAWEYIKVISVDTENKTVRCPVADFGYYLIMVSSNLADNDYRPAKRVRVKSRISGGTYEGFRFSNLVEGDVVKIYNLNGKKVAELTAGDINGFVWKGKKDTNNSGDWAESGTYIYQIKIKEKGKIISGTIAFVW